MQHIERPRAASAMSQSSPSAEPPTLAPGVLGAFEPEPLVGLVSFSNIHTALARSGVCAGKSLCLWLDIDSTLTIHPGAVSTSPDGGATAIPLRNGSDARARETAVPQRESSLCDTTYRTQATELRAVAFWSFSRISRRRLTATSCSAASCAARQRLCLDVAAGRPETCDGELRMPLENRHLPFVQVHLSICVGVMCALCSSPWWSQAWLRYGHPSIAVASPLYVHSLESPPVEGETIANF